VKLKPTRIEDVPVPELSSLALADPGGQLRLLAIGDRKRTLAQAVVSGEPLAWMVLDLDRYGTTSDHGQFEGIAVTSDGHILVLCEDPPLVLVFHPARRQAESITLLPGERGVLRDVFRNAASAGEGLLPLSDGHLLLAKEKDPPLLVEFAPPGEPASGVSASSFPTTGEWPRAETLCAVAAWSVEGVRDISDLAIAGARLYCLSDQSQRVVALELPLEASTDRARADERWDLRVPKRKGEPDGKPEGLAVTASGTLIVGLDTATPSANLCWYQP
jgi:uncharacterized protein YjiK